MSNQSPETSVLLLDLELVNRQLGCVVHLSKNVQKLARDIQLLLPTLAIKPSGHFMVKRAADWTHSYMQWVGEMLNGMDVIDERDEKWNATFREASARWARMCDELNGKVTAEEIRAEMATAVAK